MEILKIQLEEQPLIKHCMIKHLILLKIKNMIDIKGVLIQWFINFLIRKTSGGAVKNEIMQNKELAEVLHKPILENFGKKSTFIFYRQYLECSSYWYPTDK